jgi:hypothetical protein
VRFLILWIRCCYSWGQTGSQPISWILLIKFKYAPYDVTLSGFTGASVNAVTKSGTNDFMEQLMLSSETKI